MKSRHRPPLNLTDPEPEALDAAVGAPESDPSITPEDSAGAAFDAPAMPLPPHDDIFDRPMSERRRRRLLEEQGQTRVTLGAFSASTTAQPAFQTPRSRPDVDPAPSAAPPAAPVEPPVTPSFAPTATASAPVVDAPADSAPVANPPVAYAPAPVPTTKISTPPAAAAPTGKPFLIAGLASAVWVVGIAAWAAYEVGNGTGPLDPLRLALYALIALVPAGLALMLASSLRQGAGLAAETRRARDLSQALVAPTSLAARQTGDVLTALRNDIDQAALAAERARADMTLLREVLVLETSRLNEAADTAGRTARRLAEQLGRERDGMQTLGLHLDTQATGVIDAVERQSRMVMDASDLAQTQLREAEAALAARAADLAAAAGEAQDAARLASDDLARQTLRLENAGTGVAEQIQSVEEGLGQQRAALVTAAYALRTDQEDFSAQVESQRAQLSEQLSAARAASGELGDTSVKTADAMRDLVEAATDQLGALVEMSQREADGFDNATKVALDRFEALAAEARDALMEETRRSLVALQATAAESRAAAAEAAGQAQIRVDRLGEALFDAAQKADQAADARIAGAKRIVGDTADLVDEAGERAVERLEATLARLTQALAQVDTAIGDLDERTSRLPDEARARADSVRATVEEGLAALSAASRKAADENEALDAGFQERVRRNYDMLNEAVRLMGVVSGDAPTMRRREPVPMPMAVPDPAPDLVAAEERAAEREKRGFGLRGRLRLEPTPDSARPDANRPTPPDDGGLDWQDIVGGEPEDAPLDLDTPVTAADAEAMAERITASIRRMGVDPNALLPRSRVEEAAVAFTDGDPDRARQIVRRVAPAAVRSVSRRVMSDPELKSDAERYVRAFAQRLADHAREGDGPGVLGALATDAGRAFMLLDAAVGDLG